MLPLPSSFCFIWPYFPSLQPSLASFFNILPSPHSLLPAGLPRLTHHGPRGLAPQTRPPIPGSGAEDSAVVAPLPPKLELVGSRPGLGTSLQRWAEAALPGQGNVDRLLEEGMKGIPLPVEERQRSNQ